MNQLKIYTKTKTGDIVVPIDEAIDPTITSKDAYPCGITYLDDVMTKNEKPGFKDGDLMVISGKSGHGKCHGKGTEILMFDGHIKKVEDIKIGDKLMGDDNTPRKVISLATGKECLYRVSSKYGKTESYTVNESHILSLWNSSSSYGGHCVVDICLKDYIKKSENFKRMHLGYKKSVEFSKKKIPVEPYFLGLWLGDGCSLCTGITTMDKEIKNYLYRYAKRLRMKVKIRYQRENKANIYLITRKRIFKPVCNKNKNGFGGIISLQEKLRNLNLIGNKHIPYLYKTNNKKNRLKLLAGLIDSDGYVNKPNGYEFCIRNKQLAKDIVFLCRSLGFGSHFIKSKYVDGVEYKRISISGNLSIIPVKIGRKKLPVRKQIKDQLHYGIKIDKIGFGDYYGFTLDGNGRYLLGDFSVTHNTLFALNMLKNFMDNGIPSVFFSYEVIINNIYETFQEMGLKEKPIIYTPKKNITGDINWVKEKIKEADKKYGAKIAVIDHLDFLTAKNIHTDDNRRNEIHNIITELKEFAINEKKVIILLAHIIKTREKRISNEDVADSRSIVNIPDYLLFVAREVGQEGVAIGNTGMAKLTKNRYTGKHIMIKYEVLSSKIISYELVEDRNN